MTAADGPARRPVVQARYRTSAGILLYRWTAGEDGAPAAPQFLLGHLGGPLWARRDLRAWTILKGEHGLDEDALAAARREFTEETGAPVPDGPALPLGAVRQSGGKTVTAWAVEGDLDPATAVSSTFTMEWPPRSGRLQEFPEIDRVAWFGLDEACEHVVKGQVPLLQRAAELLEPDGAG